VDALWLSFKIDINDYVKKIVFSIVPRFHGVRVTDTMDAIDHFGALRQVMPNAVAISSWDPRQLVAVAAEQATSLAIGDLPSLAVYRGDGERRYLDAGTAVDRK
jgi:uncharacterized protein involved in type VI secretion and phage assembly